MKTERRDENFMNKISSCRSRDTLKSRRNNRVGRKNWMYSCVYVYCVCNSLGDKEQIASRVEFTIEVHRNRLCVIAYTSQRIFQYRTIPSKHTASKSRYIDINAHTCFIYIHTHLCTRLLKKRSTCSSCVWFCERCLFPLVFVFFISCVRGTSPPPQSNKISISFVFIVHIHFIHVTIQLLSFGIM